MGWLSCSSETSYSISAMLIVIFGVSCLYFTNIAISIISLGFRVLIIFNF
jgi:NADH:ubiquinone oxidoreductase subunit 3 (subunit A)